MKFREVPRIRLSRTENLVHRHHRKFHLLYWFYSNRNNFSVCVCFTHKSYCRSVKQIRMVKKKWNLAWVLSLFLRVLYVVYCTGKLATGRGVTFCTPYLNFHKAVSLLMIIYNAILTGITSYHDLNYFFNSMNISYKMLEEPDVFSIFCLFHSGGG